MFSVEYGVVFCNDNISAFGTLGLRLSRRTGWNHSRDTIQPLRAISMVRSTAEHGVAEAQNNLGYFYCEGKGVPTNDAEALKWLSRAAEHGCQIAQANLGLMYLHGNGVLRDTNTGYMWLVLAGNAGSRFLALMRAPVEKLTMARHRAQAWQAQHHVPNLAG